MKNFVAIQMELPLDANERAAWVHSTAADLARIFSSKVTRGRVEHGCDMGTIPGDQLLEELEMELIDGLAYIREMKRRSKVIAK